MEAEQLLDFVRLAVKVGKNRELRLGHEKKCTNPGFQGVA